MRVSKPCSMQRIYFFFSFRRKQLNLSFIIIVMGTVKQLVTLIFHGIKDCLSGILALKYFWSSRKDNLEVSTSKSRIEKKDRTNVFDVLKQCVLFGFLFWTAIMAFHKFLLKYVVVYTEMLMSPEDVQTIWWLPGTMIWIFRLTWTIPLFILSRILNYAWYQEIADLTFTNTGGKKNVNMGISYFWSDQITSLIIQVFYFMQANVIYIFPAPTIAKELIAGVHISLLYSLYAFEYKWVQMGWPLRKRFTYIDAKWPYFVGFGLPLTAVTFFTSSYIENMIIFNALFPMYVISSTVTFDSKVQNFNFNLFTFRPSTLITDHVVCKVCRYFQR